MGRNPSEKKKKGILTKRMNLYFSIICIFLVLLFITISWILYPSELNYNIFTHMLSYLGNNFSNPTGWIFFSLAMLVLSISVCIHGFYIYARVKYVSKIVSLFSLILMEFAALSLFFVAVFPDVYEQNFFEGISLGKIHNLFAVLAFLSLYAGLLGYAAIFTIDHYPTLRNTENSIFPDIKTRPFFILLGIIGIFTLISVILVKRGYYEWPGPGLLSFTFWEWMLSLTIITVFYRIVFGIPNDFSIMKIEEKN